MVEAHFLDRNHQPTTEKLESFTPLGDTDLIARFIVVNPFHGKPETLDPYGNRVQDAQFVIRQDVYRVYFYRSGSERHHIKHIAGEVAKALGIEFTSLSQLDTVQGGMIFVALAEIFLGAGYAGTENRDIKAEWGSGSCRLILGRDKPQSKIVAEMIRMEIRTFLIPVLEFFEKTRPPKRKRRSSRRSQT